jgi:GNAT superfamily N-acetyltransferase
VDDGITVEYVAAWTTWPLRQEVLRPGRAVRDCIYPGEDDPRAAHVAALRRGQAPDADLLVLAVGVVMPEPPSWEPAADDGWRIRGMATGPDVRGQGVGHRVLDQLIDHVATAGGGLLWCNARTPALTFYQRAGFRVRGDVFELPEIGPHRVMWRVVEPGSGSPAPGRSPSP